MGHVLDAGSFSNPVPGMKLDSSEVLVVVGEASGDEHAAALYRELKKQLPGVQGFGLAGDELLEEGVDSVGHASNIAVVGLFEVLKVLRRAKKLFAQLLSEVDKRGTRVAILVDAPGFNLRLAKQLSRRGVRVLYYISPQFWAWREGRVKTVRKFVDKMLVLFPFEVEWYRKRGVDAVHVGHPLVDSVPQISGTWDHEPSPERYTVTLMPGSRMSEINRLLPELAGAAEQIAESLDVQFKVIAAPNVQPEVLTRPFAEKGLDIDLVSSFRYQAIAESHLVLCASGTATLEVGLLKTPMLVLYKLNGFTHQIGKWVVKTPYVSLVNLVLRQQAVPELLQHQAEATVIAGEAIDLLSNRTRVEQMRQRLAELRLTLGTPGASRRAAQEVASVIGECEHQAG